MTGQVFAFVVGLLIGVAAIAVLWLLTGLVWSYWP